MEIVQQDSSLHGCVSTELRKTEVSSLVIGKYNPSAQAKWCDEFIECANVLGITPVLSPEYPFQVVRSKDFENLRKQIEIVALERANKQQNAVAKQSIFRPSAKKKTQSRSRERKGKRRSSPPQTPYPNTCQLYGRTGRMRNNTEFSKSRHYCLKEDIAFGCR